jgi:hypothetical protein
MPWTPDDARRFTKSATDAALRRVWASTANAALKSGHDDGEAVRIANDAVRTAFTKRQRKRQPRS